MEPVSALEPRAKRTWGVILAWIGGISAVLAFIGAVTGFFGNITAHFHHNAQLDMQMAAAQSESRQGDYQAAVQSYADILKAEPLYRPALDGQLQTTMQWVENFSVYVKEGEDAGPAAAPQLDQIIAILDAGLPRTKGAANADVEAHLGWAHWLNQHIAAREFGPAAEQDLRAALAEDPNNVYAHLMLGNWMLQNNGDFNEAVGHLRTATATGKARPFVRELQIGGLLDLEKPGASAELVRTANDMRRGNEPLDAEERQRVASWCFSLMDPRRLHESLTATAPNDVWQTYVWLNTEPDPDSLAPAYIQASLVELGGDRSGALVQFRALQAKLKRRPGPLQDGVNAAVARLSH